MRHIKFLLYQCVKSPYRIVTIPKMRKLHHLKSKTNLNISVSKNLWSIKLSIKKKVQPHESKIQNLKKFKIPEV